MNNLTFLAVKDKEHVEWLRISRSKPEIYKYFRQDRPLSIDDQRKWWANVDKNKIRLFIIVDEQGQWVGGTGFNPISLSAKRAEFTIFILPEYQHLGLGKKVIRMLLKKGFKEYGLSNIYSDVIDYPGENRFEFYKELGFEAFPREHQFVTYRKQGVTIPSIKFFMTREMYEAKPSIDLEPLVKVGREEVNDKNSDGGLGLAKSQTVALEKRNDKEGLKNNFRNTGKNWFNKINK